MYTQLHAPNFVGNEAKNGSTEEILSLVGLRKVQFILKNCPALCVAVTATPSAQAGLTPVQVGGSMGTLQPLWYQWQRNVTCLLQGWSSG